MKSFSMTDVGKSRQTNQDFIFCSNDSVGELPNLYIVADGMGGHNAGDYASRFCVEVFVEHMKQSCDKTPIGMIGSALLYANQLLIEKAASDSNLQGMGTTFVVCTIIDNIMYVGNVGDSRLYVINDNITQITEDHSLVEEMVKSGEIKRDEVRSHPNKNIITRALGANKVLVPDYFEVEINDKDAILLCSDGLSNMVEDKVILSTIKEYKDDLETVANVLIEKANDNGGKDNISLVIIRL
jgi:serine/threonine protein phosphatase PrpC